METGAIFIVAASSEHRSNRVSAIAEATTRSAGSVQSVVTPIINVNNFQ